jgi:hypothetical protein
VKASSKIEKMEWIREIEKAISEEQKRKLSFSIQKGFVELTKNNHFAPILQSKTEECSICNQSFSAFVRPHYCKVNFLFLFFIFYFYFYFFFLKKAMWKM